MAKKAHAASQHSAAAIDALLSLAAEQGWHALSLADIADRAKLSLADLHSQFESKGAILRAFIDGLDDAVLRGDVPAADASPRDRLFDVIMRRFDAMQPHKEGIRAIVDGTRSDPWLLVCSGPRVMRTATLLLEAARISTSGPAGRMKANGLAAIYLSALRTWLHDDSPDMDKTMSALDRMLRRVEGLALFVFRDRRATRSSPEEDKRAEV